MCRARSTPPATAACSTPGQSTTFNSEAVVSESRCVRLPEGVPLDVAVLFGCAVPTGAGIVLNEIAARAGATAAVFGLGGIGMIAVMALKAAGCSRIIAVDVEPAKLAAGREFGATDTIDARAVDPIAAIRALTDGLGADCAIDAAGRTRTIEQAFASVRKFGGQCVFASHPPSGERISIDPHDLISGKRLQGSWGRGKPAGYRRAALRLPLSRRPPAARSSDRPSLCVGGRQCRP